MEPDVAAARAYLDRMVGSWELTGQMGSVPLRQAVSARWVLGDRFVQVSCTQTDAAAGTTPYQALYHIGYDQAADRFAMHLLDSTGVASECPVGLGRREGQTVDFVFAYASGPFHNRFSHDPDEDVWTHELVDMAGGAARPFATKRLTRSSLERPENRGLLAYLRDRHRVDPIAMRRPPDTVDRYRLGTHPDVVERLWDGLNAALPDDAAFLVGDGPALASPHTGVVVGIALGTQYALRLTPGGREEAVAAGAATVHVFATSGGTLDLGATLGVDWVFGTWDEREGGWLAESYAAANL
jgi:Protein of unknown function (DUF1579)